MKTFFENNFWNVRHHEVNFDVAFGFAFIIQNINGLFPLPIDSRTIYMALSSQGWPKWKYIFLKGFDACIAEGLVSTGVLSTRINSCWEWYQRGKPHSRSNSISWWDKQFPFLVPPFFDSRGPAKFAMQWGVLEYIAFHGQQILSYFFPMVSLALL